MGVYQKFLTVEEELNPNTAVNTLSEWESIFFQGDDSGAGNSPFNEQEFATIAGGTVAERQALIRSVRTHNYGGSDYITEGTLEINRAPLTEAALTKLLTGLIPNKTNFPSPTYTIRNGLELGATEFGNNEFAEHAVLIDYARPRTGVGTDAAVSSALDD